MVSIRRMLIVAILCASVAPDAFAQKEYETSPLPDSTRTAVGDWIGGVSWNEAIVQYSWSMYADGTFTSGRAGRAQDGAGAWGTQGTHLTLKYTNGFRYEGDLKRDQYYGSAYTAEGHLSGAFHMRRNIKNFEVPEAAP